MTDRNSDAPPDKPARPPAAARPTAPEDDGPLMSVTLATLPGPNPTASGGTDAASRDGHPSAGRAWLDRLFADEFSFPAITPAALPVTDRTPAGHEAAARAAGCGDLFVVHADPPAGERLIADLVAAIADRALILSPDPAAADRVAERLARAGASVLRALADDENPVRPSPVVSRLTSAARLEQLRREAADAVVAAEGRLAAFSSVAKAVDRLKEVNARLARLDAEVAEQTDRRRRVEQEALADAALSAALARLDADHAAATEQLRAELRAVLLRLDTLGDELAAARRQYADATRKPGLFSRLFGARPAATGAEAEKLEGHLRATESEAAALAARAAECQARLDAAEAAFAAEREKLVTAEVDSRRAAIDAGLADTGHERDRARAEAEALARAIETHGPGDDHADAERQLAAAYEYAAEVARRGPELAARAAEARVVVGTPGSLESDPAFAAATGDPPFALLVLDRAEELPETEFDRLSRLAGRWVLVGDALPRDEARPTRPPRNGRPAERSFVARLARLLDRETWANESGRVVCRLSHPTAEQRRGMTREPLADRPEIELRFVPNGDEPLLAEIGFPADTPLPAVKSFLYHELGEVLLRPCGEHRWHNHGEAITVAWPAAGTDGVWIDLEPGVREKVSGSGLFAFTAAVSFDTSAGWDSEKAEAWLALHLPPPPCGRFAVLPLSPGPRGFAPK
jgi:hypothetical protein